MHVGKIGRESGKRILKCTVRAATAQPGVQVSLLYFLGFCSIKANIHLSNSKNFPRSQSYHVYIHCYRNTCDNMRCSLQLRMLYLLRVTKEIVRCSIKLP